jgi:hypothetical protein
MQTWRSSARSERRRSIDLGVGKRQGSLRASLCSLRAASTLLDADKLAALKAVRTVCPPVWSPCRQCPRSDLFEDCTAQNSAKPEVAGGGVVEKSSIHACSRTFWLGGCGNEVSASTDCQVLSASHWLSAVPRARSPTPALTALRQHPG